MSGYIDRNLALSMPWANGKYDHEHADKNFILGLETYKNWLETLEPADVAEVKHGHLIYHDDPFLGLTSECSNCHIQGMLSGNYCPNCGASLEKGDLE